MASRPFFADNNVPLDVVALRLETRGFIDKPIAFEMNREKIVELLIGDHLYANRDVAIRELVQNSLDACKLRQALQPGRTVQDHRGENVEIETLVVEDNGLGMGFSEAKEFLSTIGSSFSSSASFRERFAGKGYSPIARYGIGILSCFLICDGMTVDTYKEGQDPCKFSVESLRHEWKYEKGSLRTPGTRITLQLNEYGQNIILKDSLSRYPPLPGSPS